MVPMPGPWYCHPMGMLSPHRRFVDPGNTEGIPKVRPRGPLPVRDKPLPGTKVMHTPHDGSLEDMLRRKADTGETSRVAHVLGWLAVAGVLGLWVLLWIMWRDPGVSPYSHGGLFTGVVILALGGIHVLAIFSQILSRGRNLPGALSILMLYVGTMLLAVVDHFTR